MKMDPKLYQKFCIRSEPYMWEGTAAFAMDIIFILLLFVVFYYGEIIRYAIPVALVFLLIEFLLNLKVAFLCFLDKIGKRMEVSKGTLLSLDTEGSHVWKAGFGKLMAAFFDRGERLGKAKIRFIDESGKKRICRLVATLKYEDEIQTLIKSEWITSMKFVTARHSRLLLKCSAHYRDGIREEDKERMESVIHHLNVIRYR